MITFGHLNQPNSDHMRKLLQKSLQGWRLNSFMFVAIFCCSLFASFAAFAQRAVQGKITSGEDQSPLPGVNILVKGTNTGTISDATGSFQLSVPSENDVLVFSFVGFLTQEVPVGSKTVFDIVLQSDAKQLSEVVVTALGIEKDKAKLGYAVQDLKGEDIVKAREPNPINSLVGKVAGLTVASSAEILGAPNLYLRGKRPLFVVDGVPIQSDTWNISADDIESYTVLKGPAASALYGSRGINGAIQITTKRGSKDQRGFSVEFNSSTMIEKGFLTIPKVQDEYGPGDHGRYAFADGKGGGLYDSDYDIWGPKFEGQLIPQYDGEYTPNQTYTTTLASGATFTGNIKPTPWVARGKDNLKRFLEVGVLSTNNIAVSTSGSNYDLRFSYSHNYQKGQVPNTDLNADNFNVAVGVDLSPKIRFESNLNYNHQYTENIPDVNYGPNSMIYNIVIWGGADWDIADMKKHIFQPGKEGIQQMYADYTRYNNPYFLTNYWLRGHYKTDTYGYMSLKYSINKDIELVGRSQINTYNIFRNEKFPYSATVYGREQAKGDYREDNRTLFENNTDVLLTYHKEVTPDFNVRASLGANARTFNYKSSYVTTDYLNVPGLYNFTNSLNPIRAYNFNSDMQVLSAYGYVDLDYKNFLSLSVTGRSDKHSTLPSGSRAYFYPSASLSGVISQVVDLPEFMSFLKVRGSYAKVGAANTMATIGPSFNYVGSRSNPLDYGSTYSSPYDGPNYANSQPYQTGRMFNNVTGASYSSTLANANLKPSFSNTWETGVDMKFINNRLGLDVTYFQAIDGPGIFNRQISESTGYTDFQDNGIKTTRKGWEVTVQGTPVKGEKFSWNVLLNGSTYKEVLTDVAPGLDRVNATYFNGSSDGNNSFIKVGERIDRYFGHTFLKTPDGQIINDASGRPLVNPVPQYLGNLNPDFVWGFTNKFSYKNFTLVVQFDGRVGGKIVDYIQRQTYRGGRIINTVEGAMGEARYQDYLGVKSWVGPGVQPSGAVNVDGNGQITNYNELTYTPNNVKTYLQDWISRYYAQEEANLISRSYAKLREVTITYQLPSSVLGNSFVRQASISLISRNLLYFAARKDLDIDQYGNNLQGYSSLQSPTTRRYGINLNVTF